MASTRLPDKPLVDIAGLPMVVRVARQASLSRAARVVVAADDCRIVEACERHGVQALMTRADHASGSDRVAEAAALLGLADDALVVNVQGDEPMIEPGLIDRCAERLAASADCVMATVAHPITSVDEFLNPNVVKVVLDAAGRALLFSRAPLPWWRDGVAPGPAPLSPALPLEPPALRHVGLYAYRAGFLRLFPTLAPAPLERCESLEQLRVLWHGHRIAVLTHQQACAAGVDTAEDLARVRAALSR